MTLDLPFIPNTSISVSYTHLDVYKRQPLSNSNGLPIISPKIAPYIYASNPRITPVTLFLCYNMIISNRCLYMVAVPATVLRTKTDADTINTDVTHTN